MSASNHDLQIVLSRARVRIAQAAQLLEQETDVAMTAESCLHAADTLWRELAALTDAEPDRWRTVQVDGLRAEQVLQRLNDVVYELLTVGQAF